MNKAILQLNDNAITPGKIVDYIEKNHIDIILESRKNLVAYKYNEHVLSLIKDEINSIYELPKHDARILLIGCAIKLFSPHSIHSINSKVTNGVISGIAKLEGVAQQAISKQVDTAIFYCTNARMSYMKVSDNILKNVFNKVSYEEING